MTQHFHNAEYSFTLHFLLQSTQRLVNVIIMNNDLNHAITPFLYFPIC